VVVDGADAGGGNCAASVVQRHDAQAVAAEYRDEDAFLVVPLSLHVASTVVVVVVVVGDVVVEEVSAVVVDDDYYAAKTRIASDDLSPN